MERKISGARASKKTADVQEPLMPVICAPARVRTVEPGIFMAISIHILSPVPIPIGAPEAFLPSEYDSERVSAPANTIPSIENASISIFLFIVIAVYNYKPYPAGYGL